MLWSILLAAAPPKVEVDYQEFAGLQIKVNGIHVVQGSAFQIYEEGWARGIYSSNWRPKQIHKLSNAGVLVRFSGDQGQITGNQVYQRTADGVRATYEFTWKGSKSVRLENCLGLMWGPAFEAGALKVDGQDGLRMDRPLNATLTPQEKRLGPEGGDFEIDAPFASVSIKINPDKALLFDARGHDQDWARNKELFWLGFLEQKLEPFKTLRYEVEWTFHPKLGSGAGRTADQPVTSAAVSSAIQPSATNLPLIPAPKKRADKAGAGAELGRSLKIQAPEDLAKEFQRQLWRRWDRRSVPEGPVSTQIQCRVQPIGTPPEGYRLSVSNGRIEVLGQDLAGVRNGLRTLAWLAQAKNGRLVVPPTEITDYPSLPFRGIHMFVGPTALAFQTKLMDDYLAPLKVNHVVLQCERTRWKTLPGIETPITMEKKDLGELVARYRERGIEPIPLIQSLGHTYWVFENKKNLDIAINPDEAFTLDPRKDRTRQVLTDLWAEAIDLMKPKTIHFGLDEIDMRGMPNDPFLSSRLWTLHLPWLQDLAAKHNVAPMMWGDIMLAPGEAPDATHAKTPEAAKERRASIRKGAYIADWHYKEDPNPEIYTSLALFKSIGLKPIAATWDRPNNIRGFALAAIASGSQGLLQTTWAGYESSEPNLVKAFDQFAAYALAADYAWSGRQEMPDKLPYDPREALTRLYFAPPEAVTTLKGDSLIPTQEKPGAPIQIGQVSFRLFSPLRLNTPISPEGLDAPDVQVIKTVQSGRELCLAVDCAGWVADNDVLGKVEILMADGSRNTVNIAYGQHARAPRDPRPTLLAFRAKIGPGKGLSAVRIPITDGAAKRIREVKITKASPSGGLRVHGITMVTE